tara:strand:- start:846 stop:1055 length:210 start_codon:yes stop_codon:yes gene_type:complete
MVKFKEYDYKGWEIFRMGTNDVISAEEFNMVCELHAKYYKHSFYKPCTCNPKIIRQWVKELNIVFENGN